MKVRQDAWSEENDLLLAETVLRHVREGSTQLKAFEEVGNALNRTGAACGFRWNAVIRQQYEKAFGLARKQRKQYFRNVQKKERPSGIHVVSENNLTDQDTIEIPSSNTLTMRQIIDFLQNINASEVDYKSLRREFETVKQEKAAIETKYGELEKRTLTMQQDYENLVNIMDRARKMVVFGDEAAKKPVLHIESNQDLEKAAE
ncbi:RsfA family transcriptional regulator [Domibacillus sp. DTU_2020_1001157_1_SI_ALB_TIR_016]|uniref:RsfA family transcriptional regulator n=1 Tax=Domibacillus sp. DTU_2020_1001157_1_SI_ALB_TIR_016 TaxID=3077789 RepID=UPI0028E63195|nr:RsfA family transcriptional regulator [Domibacillus sp. DTU_2020_1001157_1_SI_ALB_TIR_016]WNS78768.1 RsfA family transcriptional regulator [Domibacillus sp. DTU_2020_1001157_1_SI_ALB_TIR_016]